ncbi:MAG: hypothetical protein ACRC0R_02190 [Cetobacterium sp.]
MKYLLIFSMILFTGCFSIGIRRDYQNYQNDFYKLVSNPIIEKDRSELEQKFKSFKNRVSKEEYSKREKEKIIVDIDYYLMILEDLKD